MAKPIKICADSTCDLPKDLLEKYNIDVFALPVNLGDKPCLDGVDVHPDDLYEYYRRTGKLTTTSAPSPTMCEDWYRPYVEQGYAVIHFSISSEMTVTHANHKAGAAAFEDVYPVDSRSLSSGMGMLAIRAAKMVQEGKSVEEILAAVNELRDHIEVSFVLDQLEYMWKGGRCSGVAALGANVLKLKPCIEVRDAKMGVTKKYRGNLASVHMQFLEDKLKGRSDLDLDTIFITHSRIDPSYIEAVSNKIRELQPFANIIPTDASCSVCNHCGPNTLGIIYMTK